MLKIADLCHALELAVPPLAGCEDFDGVAFMPDGDRPVKRVAVALDADIFTARAAVGAVRPVGAVGPAADRADRRGDRETAAAAALGL